jgi:FkbM family methyltransferase
MHRAFVQLLTPFRRHLTRKTYHGIKVPLDGAHVIRPIWQQVFRGEYEQPEIQAALALVRPGDTILELGAGMGVVSGVVAKARPDVSIHSYEANPAMIPEINKLHRRNGITNVKLHNEILLPDASETPRQFHVTKSFAESSLLEASSQHQQSVEVPVKDIRKLLVELKPDVLMCDIEGAEVEVFNDLDLSSLRAVVVELHPHMTERSAIANIHDELTRNGLYPIVELCSGTVLASERVAS